MKAENRNYRVVWNGHNQPLGSDSWHSVKMYILFSLRLGNCYLSQFRIYDKYGEIKTELVHSKECDPTLLTSYLKIN